MLGNKLKEYEEEKLKSWSRRVELLFEGMDPQDNGSQRGKSSVNVEYNGCMVIIWAQQLQL